MDKVALSNIAQRLRLVGKNGEYERKRVFARKREGKVPPMQADKAKGLCGHALDDTSLTQTRRKKWIPVSFMSPKLKKHT